MLRWPIHPPPSVYLPFLKNAGTTKCSLTIHIMLELRDMPAVESMTKIFDSDQSWSMFRHNDEHIIALKPPVLNNQTVWLARFQEELSGCLCILQ